jgi:hypothetical protein
MRAADPSIRFLFGDKCYWKPDYYAPLIGGAYDVTGAENGVRYIDGVTFHSYPLPGDGMESRYTRNDVIWGAAPNMRGQFRRCLVRAQRADSLHGRTGGRGWAAGRPRPFRRRRFRSPSSELPPHQNDCRQYGRCS